MSQCYDRSRGMTAALRDVSRWVDFNQLHAWHVEMRSQFRTWVTHHHLKTQRRSKACAKFGDG
ncbi:hypothetical protein D3C84_999710 [compost metagenome]